MLKSIKTIVETNDDLHFMHITKPDKNNRRTWTIDIIDSTSRYAGISDYLHKFDYRIVTLRKENDFFLAYKIYFEKDYYEYLVDSRKANHRNSPKMYINSLMKYSVYSNDISRQKNDSSFKVTDMEMKHKGIDNYIDLCYHYGEYTAIGTGITRNVRNVVVMDIDVNCEREDNARELNNLLLTFGKYNALPDFVIHNHESKHVQLQWLIQSFDYKLVKQKVIDDLENMLENDPYKDKEIKLLGTDFLELSEIGLVYRTYTMAMTNIVPKHKFGDKQYTFWKAKNFYAAYLGINNLELKMPYFNNGEIRYLSKEQMNEIFSTKESRAEYYAEAPTIVELMKKTDLLISPLAEKINKKKLKRVQDEDVKELKAALKKEKEQESLFDETKNYGRSRNMFVFVCTRETTWEVARDMNYRNTKDIQSLEESDLKIFKNRVHTLVKKRFNDEDKKYNGIWPDTSNFSPYRDDEFESTFNTSFNFALNKLNASAYSDKQRESSNESRHLKKDLHLSIVDYFRRTKKMKRDELLSTVNKVLVDSGQKVISLSSLKRYITESKSLTMNDRRELYKEFVKGVEDRRKQLQIAQDKRSKKAIDTYTKRYNYLNVNIIDDIKEMAHL